jgi:hypothetical protein
MSSHRSRDSAEHVLCADQDLERPAELSVTQAINEWLLAARLGTTGPQSRNERSSCNVDDQVTGKESDKPN